MSRWAADASSCSVSECSIEGQTWATFKMLFNAIFLAGTGPPPSDPQTIDN